MPDMIRKLPIGIQDFEKLRAENYLYVDKTKYIYNLVHMGKPYFLSRPRRFGKSLFLSTLRAYWEGKKEFFKGLDIEKLEKDNPDAWQEYPVFYFDFNKKDFQRESALEEVLNAHLIDWEKKYDLISFDLPIEERFQNLIKTAYEKTGKRVVILVDEYDKPLLEVITDNELEEHNKSVFKGFFSTLKSYDRYIEFEFLTGVTKFSKVSIFSDLNHLRDISLSEEYAGICGITEAELKNAFMPEVEAMAAKQRMSLDECLEKLGKTYDGYHFNKEADGVYNPFSLINALQAKEFDSFWFSTGTPTFLIKKLNAINFDAKKFTDGNLYADSYTLFDYRADNPDPIPLFYQTGYLTIKGYDKKFDSYQLGYPNDEVKYSFIKSLAPSYLHSEDEEPLDIRNFGRDIESANFEGIKDRFTELFARLPYGNDEKYVERDFQNVVYITFMLLGQFVHTEMHTAKGRADCIVEADDYIYIFEFKRDADADTALAQIEEKGYAKAYVADSRKIIKVGVNFDTESRSISDWKVME